MTQELTLLNTRASLSVARLTLVNTSRCRNRTLLLESDVSRVPAGVCVC